MGYRPPRRSALDMIVVAISDAAASLWGVALGGVISGATALLVSAQNRRTSEGAQASAQAHERSMTERERWYDSAEAAHVHLLGHLRVEASTLASIRDLLTGLQAGAPPPDEDWVDNALAELIDPDAELITRAEAFGSDALLDELDGKSAAIRDLLQRMSRLVNWRDDSSQPVVDLLADVIEGIDRALDANTATRYRVRIDLQGLAG